MKDDDRQGDRIDKRVQELHVRLERLAARVGCRGERLYRDMSFDVLALQLERCDLLTCAAAFAFLSCVMIDGLIVSAIYSVVNQSVKLKCGLVVSTRPHLDG